MFNRTMRAEARNRAKEEIRRVINCREQVRKWEKKWVVVKDTTMKIYKWVPISDASVGSMKLSSRRLSTKAPPTLPDPLAPEGEQDASLDNQDSQGSENTQQSSGKPGGMNLNDDSRTGYSDADYDTDSNTGLVNQYDPNNSQTDFSSLQNDENLEQFATPNVPGMMEPPAKRYKP